MKMKRLHFLFALVTALILVLGMAAPISLAEEPPPKAAENLLADGGFESTPIKGDDPGFNHNTLYTGNWVNVCWCEPFTDIKHGGNQSMKICYSFNGLCGFNVFPGIYQDVAVTSNSSYKLKFWARSDNENKTILHAGYRNPNAEDVWNPVQEYDIQPEEISTEWKEYTYTLTVDDLDTIRVEFFAQGVGEQDYRAFYIDDVTLELDEEATAAALADAKEKAKSTLSAYAELDDYDPAAQDQVKDAIEAGNAAIDAADNIDAVNQALAEAKARIDAIAKKQNLPVQENLLQNGDFEKDIVNGDANAVGFDHNALHTGNWVNVCWCDLFDGFKQDGNRSLKICYSFNGECNSTDFPGVYQDVAVKPNSVYTISFWARVDNEQKTDLNVGYRNPKSSDVWTPVENHVIPAAEFGTEFRKYEYTLTVYDLDTIRVNFYTSGVGAQDYRAFYIDQVIFTYAGEAGLSLTSGEDVVMGELQPLTTDGNNLLANPNFETAFETSDPTRLQTGKWNSIVGGYDGQNDGGLEGSMCGKITYQWENGLNEEMYIGFYQDVPVEKNTTYQFSVYISKWYAQSPDCSIYIGFTDAIDPDHPAAQYHTQIRAADLNTAYVKYTIYFHTGYLECARVFLCAQGQSGNNGGGYNFDNASLCKVTGATSRASATGGIALHAGSPYVYIGDDTNKLQVGRIFDWQYFDPLKFSDVQLKIDHPELLKVASDGTLRGLAAGTATVTATQGGASAQLTLTVRQHGQEELDCVLDSNEMEVGSRQSYYVVLKNAKGTILPEEDYSYQVVSSNQAVLMPYATGASRYLYGVSCGQAQLSVTAYYQGEKYTKTCDVTVTGKDLLVDGGFEFYNELNPLGLGWKLEGSCGVDSYVDSTLARSGNGNIWCMAPTNWDASIPADSEVKLYQDVTVERADLYRFGAYIHRFYANAVDGDRSGYGGEVFMGIVPLDGNGAEQQAESIGYGIDMGIDEYQQVTCTRRLEPGRYRVVILIKGDPYFGLGMQVDDASLVPTSLPKRLLLTVGESNGIQLGDMEEVTVQLEREDGSMEELENVHVMSLNRNIGIMSGNFLVPRATGTLELKAVYRYEGQEIVGNLAVKVFGEEVQVTATDGFHWWMAAIPAAVLIIAAAVVVILLLRKRKHKPNGGKPGGESEDTPADSAPHGDNPEKQAASAPTNEETEEEIHDEKDH